MAIVNRKELAGLLAQVAPGVGAKETTLQETCFVISAGYVYAYNDEICISAKLPDSMADMDEFAIQARELIAIVNKLKDAELDMDITGSELVIKTKRAKAEMKIEGQIKMPINEIQFPEKWIPLPDRFSVALKDVLPAVSRDASKKLATCVFIHDNVLEASDVDKAARYTFDKSVFPKKKVGIFLPRLPASSVVIKFLPEAYAADEGWIHFKNGDAILSCRLYYHGQEFVDLSPLIDAEGIVVELPEELPNALERAGVFVASSDGTEITHEDRYVNVRIIDGWCLIYGEGGAGRYEESMKINYDGDDIEFNTDVQTLVNAVAENQTVEICEGYVKISDDNFSYIVSFKGV